MANSHVAELPAASVAVHSTSVGPGGKKLPEGGVQTMAGEGSTSSLAVTENVTVSPGAEPGCSRTTRSGGQWRIGDVASGQVLQSARKLSPTSEARVNSPAARSDAPTPGPSSNPFSA